MKRAVAIAVCTLWPGLAFAGGYEYPDNGAIAMGRGSAFAAKADDGTAIYYNPSGLAAQTGWRIMVDGQAAFQSLSFQRTDVTGADIGPMVSNSGAPTIAPFVAVSKQLLPGLTVAIGVYAPPAAANEQFPDDPAIPQLGTSTSFIANKCELAVATSQCPGGNVSSLNTAPQKYELIKENLTVLYPTVSAAWAPWFLRGIFAVGASLQLEYASSSIRKATYDGAIGEWQNGGSKAGWVHQPANELLTYDTIANVAVSGSTVTAVFGATVKPLRNMRIGASYRPKHTLTQSGTLKLDYSPSAQFLGAQASGNNTNNNPDGNLAASTGPTTLASVFPGELKTGVDYDFGFGDVELDFNYTQWSQYGQATLTPEFQTTVGSNSAQVPPVAILHNYRDTWALRLGADFKIPVPVVRLTLRCGGGYESSAYNPDEEDVQLDEANFAQIHGAIGATVGYGWFDLDLAYSHVYMPEADVRNSNVQATQNIPPSTPAGFTDSPMVVGNGNYKASYDLLAVGLRAHF